MIRNRRSVRPRRPGNALLLALAVVVLLSLSMLVIGEASLRTREAVSAARLRHQAELAGLAMIRLSVDELALPDGVSAMRVNRPNDGFDVIEMRADDGRLLALDRLPHTTETNRGSQE